MMSQVRRDVSEERLDVSEINDLSEEKRKLCLTWECCVRKESIVCHKSLMTCRKGSTMC